MQRGNGLEGIPGTLWQRIAGAKDRVLMLDFDGTLAPFVAARDEARALPEAIGHLRRIAAEGRARLAIVSGRPLEELEDLVRDVPAALFGVHGWERRAGDGRITRFALDLRERAALDEADRVARASGWSERIERKRAAVVLHTRSLPPPEARALDTFFVREWAPLATATDLALERMDGGVELRARRHHKGTVVHSLHDEAPPGALGVFVGDDVADEDAFEAVRAWGFGVRVGAEERRSFAEGRLPDPAAVAEFLAAWIRTAQAA